MGVNRMTKVNLKVHLPDWFTRLYTDAIWKMNTNDDTVYLTFDDGPIPVVTPAVLNILKEQNVVATFFCVGDNVSKYPEIYQQILDEGHAVGNHTFNHLNGMKNASSTYLSNVKKAAEVIKSNLFRPPYGLLKQSQYKVLSRHYNIIMWDVISCDYEPTISVEKCISNVMDFVRSGSIITFHDSVKSQKTLLEALPVVIDLLKQKGYRFDRIHFENTTPGKTTHKRLNMLKSENKIRERA